MDQDVRIGIIPESESESEVLFILGQPLAHRATIKVPSKGRVSKYVNQHADMLMCET